MTMKYLVPVNKMKAEIAEVFKEQPMRSGCYNWVSVFDGNMAAYTDVKDDLEKFDVIHVNLCPADWWIALDAAKKLKNSSTKLVMCNDHVSEFWHKWELDPSVYLQVQEGADVLFGTEPYQTSQMLDKAFTMPHPTATNEIKFMKNKFTDSNKVGFMCHAYDRTVLQRVLMARALKEDIKCKTALYNYVPSTAKEQCISDYWFDEIYKQFDFMGFCMSMMGNKVMLELADYHTYGRATVETAACGVPTVGSDRVGSMRHNFPNLCCDPYDHRKIRELVKKVWTDNKFRQEQIDYAYNACEHYNYKNCKERMMKALDGVRK